MRLLAVLASAFLLSAPALADHAGDNAAEIARAAYRAADEAEALAFAARGDFGPLEDHRHDNLRGLAQVADRLHYDLSDLYRAARFGGGGGPTPEDHRGDRIREAYYPAAQSFQELRNYWYELSRYPLDYEIRRLYQSTERTFERLEWLVLARQPE